MENCFAISFKNENLVKIGKLFSFAEIFLLNEQKEKIPDNRKS
jgi:hypothetical protein